MDMGNFRPELHVPQQSLRDKLRIQNDSNPLHHHLGVYANNLEQLPSSQVGLNYESANLQNFPPGNTCYDPPEFCSEMLVNSQGMTAQRDGLLIRREPYTRVGEAAIGKFFPTTFNPSATVSCDPQYFSTWKSIGSQSSRVANQSPFFVGDDPSAGSPLKVINSAPISTSDVKRYVERQEFHSPVDNPSIAVASSSLYQNALQELTTLKQKSWDETNHGVVGGGELLLLPAYATDQLRLKSPHDLTSRPAGGRHRWGWGGELDYAAVRNTDDGDLTTASNDNSNTHALSLSLSSVPSPTARASQIADRASTADLHSRDAAGANIQDSGAWKPEYSSPCSNLLTGSKTVGTAGQGTMSTQALAHRNLGPLGPFTGYATVLRRSKFLWPAQQLLDELCHFARPKAAEICEAPDKILEEVRVSDVTDGNAGLAVKAVAGDHAGGSSLAFSGSTGKRVDPWGMSCPPDSYQPENLQKKATLLCMQDEVCKRYKQYCQQMHMVVSSFESVAGLGAATPYISLALTMVFKDFQCLKNAITNQLKALRDALAEDLCKDGAGVSTLKVFNQSLQKQRGAGGQGVIHQSQHIWRPQRGLPEHAVSILRAWLFDHFLHPYPTDTDKHMLAAQTGLTRNQVSNWFINARVRVWKPMVEEMHMLETKGVAHEIGLDTGKTTVEGCDQPSNTTQSLNMLSISTVPANRGECSSISPPEREASRSNAYMWNRDKRSRIEYCFPSTVNGLFMGFVSGIEIGGQSAVSLTLGLRQSPENTPWPPLQQDHHLRPPFGGQVIQDFVG